MSFKAARGMKRVCQNCSSKFYDLNRDPIICPICNTVFQLQEPRPKAALAAKPADVEDEEVIASPKEPVEIVSLEEVEADEEEIPEIEDTELVDIEEDEAELGDDDETFIEVEEDDGDEDVSGIVAGSRDDEED